MKKLVLSIGLLAIGFGSCQKQKVETERSQTNSAPSIAQMDSVDSTDGLITASAANPENPYDYYGELHNNILDATKSIWVDTNITTSSIYDAVVATDLDTVDNPFSSLNDISASTDFVLNNIDQTDMLIDASDLSYAGKLESKSLINVLKNWKDYDTYVDFKLAVISIESQILANNSLTNFDKTLLMKEASILRYSVKYWVNFSYTLINSYTLVSSNQNGTNGMASPMILGGLGDAWKKVKDFCSKYGLEILLTGAGADVIALLVGLPLGPGDLAAAGITSAKAAGTILVKGIIYEINN